MIQILHPGIYNTIQDTGRVGFAKIGVPTAGSLDSYSAELANTILHNKKTAAVIEITFGQGKFEFTTATDLCVTGGDFSPKINSEPIAMNQVYAIKKGAILSFGKRNYGARTYVAVVGGIDSDIILGSRSFSAAITHQRLEKGDTLKILDTDLHQEKGFSRVKIHEKHFSSPILACFPGPEYELLNDLQKQQLLASFSISEDNNRVGVRLKEAVKNSLESILTSAVLPGTVQLTPSGKLILLMRDCQVTGGYPRVLQLSETAISRLAQKIAGEEVQFVLR